MKTSSNTKPDSVPTPLHRDVKRTVLKIAGATLLSFAAGIYYLRSDIAPPDVADLEAQPALNTASDDFSEVNRELYTKLPKKEWETASRLRGDLMQKNVWDNGAVEKLLNTATQAEVWPLIEKVRRADRGPTSWGTPRALIGVFSSIEMAGLMVVRAENFARHGQPDLALDETTKIVTYGRNEAHAGATIIIILGSDAVQSIGCGYLRRAIKEYTFSEEAMRRAITELERNRISQQMFDDAIRGEFAFVNGLIKTDSINKHGIFPKRELPDFLITTTLRKNETIKFLADYYRAMLVLPRDKNWQKEANVIRERALEEVKESGISNFAGKKLLGFSFNDLSPAYSGYRRVNSCISAAQAALAVRLYQTKHNGALPETLEELVREGILASVPLDYMDEQPIRYSKELRVVWTIGLKGWNPPFPDSEHEDFEEAEGGIFRL
jgi:hypothetical protein